MSQIYSFSVFSYNIQKTYARLGICFYIFFLPHNLINEWLLIHKQGSIGSSAVHLKTLQINKNA